MDSIYQVRLTYCVKVMAYCKLDAELKAISAIERDAKKAQLIDTEIKMNEEARE